MAQEIRKGARSTRVCPSMRTRTSWMAGGYVDLDRDRLLSGRAGIDCKARAVGRVGDPHPPRARFPVAAGAQRGPCVLLLLLRLERLELRADRRVLREGEGAHPGDLRRRLV